MPYHIAQSKLLLDITLDLIQWAASSDESKKEWVATVMASWTEGDHQEDMIEFELE